MADKAHRLTDEKLEEMEKRLSANGAVEKNRNSASMHSEGMGTDAENKARLDGL